MLFALLFLCTKEDSCTTKIKTFIPLLILPLLNIPPSSKHIPYPSYLCFEVSVASLVIFTPPNNSIFRITYWIN